jgi:hypothetical protein
MTLEEFKGTLAGLQPGKAAHVNYEMFEVLFPPGIEDDGAKERANSFAKEHGCVIEHPGKRPRGPVRQAGYLTAS